MDQGLSPLRGLAKLRTVKSRRFSSFDPTGGNDDRLHIPPGETVPLAEMGGAGIITHIWIAAHCPSLHFLKKLVVRAYWDNESRVPRGAPFLHNSAERWATGVRSVRS
jgi:hypothetical protein